MTIDVVGEKMMMSNRQTESESQVGLVHAGRAKESHFFPIFQETHGYQLTDLALLNGRLERFIESTLLFLSQILLRQNQFYRSGWFLISPEPTRRAISEICTRPKPSTPEISWSFRGAIHFSDRAYAPSATPTMDPIVAELQSVSNPAIVPVTMEDS